MNESRLRQFLDRLPQRRIAVVGDFFIDRYLHIDPALDEPSLETGLTAYQVTEVRDQAGAAGTVTSNLHALGVGTLYAVSIIGDDGAGMSLRRDLLAKDVRLDFLLEAPGRLTPTYTKPLRMMQDEAPEELHRLDMRTRGHVPAELEDRLLEAIDAVIGCVDAVVIADQISTSNEGMITDRVRSELVGLARKRTDKNFIADSRSHIAQFKHMITKPNQFEAVRIMGAGEGSARDPDAMGKLGRQIAEKNQQPVFITLGAEGILACTESSATHIPTWRAEGEIDAVGAGDSTLSGIISATIAGANVEEAAILGNMVASVTVEQIGTTGTASPQQVISRYRRWAELHPHLAQ